MENWTLGGCRVGDTVNLRGARVFPLFVHKSKSYNGLGGGRRSPGWRPALATWLDSVSDLKKGWGYGSVEEGSWVQSPAANTKTETYNGQMAIECACPG